MASSSLNISSLESKYKPLVSVIISVYNGEQFLEEALESILDQTYTHFELLILDDGSSDDSLSILRRFERRDHRIHVVTRENRGLVRSLNELIAMSKGVFLARMDADDISLPERFEKQVAFLQENTDVAAVGSAFLLIDARGRKIAAISSPLDHNSIEQELLRGHCVLSHPSVMIRADAMARAEGYREAFTCAQDLDLWLRMSEFAKLANLPDVLLYYRIHATSISEASGIEQRAAKDRATNEAWVRRGIEGKFVSEGHWRSDGSHSSILEFTLKYGWMAWSNGYRGTWQSYALRALRLNPLSIEAWRLAVFGLLKRPSLVRGAER